MKRMHLMVVAFVFLTVGVARASSVPGGGTRDGKSLAVGGDGTKCIPGDPAANAGALVGGGHGGRTGLLGHGTGGHVIAGYGAECWRRKA